jgi:hypothetical protein
MRVNLSLIHVSFAGLKMTLDADTTAVAITPDAVSPPDDSGSTTLQRYRYQAKVVFPFTLSCALDQNEVAVIPEHVEDLALQYDASWRFAQIKSRQASQGTWTLSDLLDKDGGPLPSLYRAFKATRGTSATYELFLEQAISPTNPILALKKGTNQSLLIKKVAKGLRIKEQDAKQFLQCVRLHDPLPTQQHIDAVNIMILMAQHQGLTHQKATSIYRRALERIEKAMRAEPPSVSWPEYVKLEPHNRADEIYDAKCLTRDVCRSLFSELSGPANRLLKRTVDPALSRPSRLKAKLILADAPDALIESAITLRANATTAVFEALNLASASPGSVKAAQLEDVRERLFHRATGIIEQHREQPQAAVQIWNELMKVLGTEAVQLDPNQVFNQDQMLLMGQICEISDECRTDWGGRRA